MIEEKDYMMRLIRKVGAFLRLMFNGDSSQIDEMEVEDMLSDLAGLPVGMLLQMNHTSLLTLLRQLSDADRIGMAAALLVVKGRLAQRDDIIAAGESLLKEDHGTRSSDLNKVIEELLQKHSP